MTEPLFFDTDCLSAFLWVNNQSILVQLYPNRIVIPQEVYAELSNPCIPHLKSRVESLIRNQQIKIEGILVGSPEYDLYKEMVFGPYHGQKVIGKGEAAAIVLAKNRKGILASNNLKDIEVYIKKYKLINMTTGDILKEALSKELITEEDGNKLWNDMLKKRRKLGYNSFSDYLRDNA